MKTSRKWFLFLMAFALALPVAASAEGNYGYDKGFFIKSDDGNFMNTVYAWAQTGYLATIVKGPTDNTFSFTLPTARVGWFGNAFSKNIQYRLEVDFAAGGVQATQLTDAYANFVYNESLQVQGGQFKVPFNYEALVADNMLNFPTRSIVNNYFSFEHHLGAMIHGSAMDKMIEYYVGAFNTTDNPATINILEKNGRQLANPRNELLWAGRVMANLMGNVGYSMADLKNSETPNVSFGLGIAYDTVNPSGADDIYQFSMSPDINVRYLGFSLLAEFDWTKLKSVKAGYGFDGTLGYFVLPETVEVAARYAYLKPVAGAAKSQEIGAAINYYLHGHQVKAGFLFDYVKNDGTGLKTYNIGLQTQVGFF